MYHVLNSVSVSYCEIIGQHGKCVLWSRQLGHWWCSKGYYPGSSPYSRELIFDPFQTVTADGNGCDRLTLAYPSAIAHY